MKKSKCTRCIAFALSVLITVLSAPTAAFAANPGNDNNEFDLNDYIQHTIEFNVDTGAEATVLTANAAGTNTSRWAQHVSNVEAAKDYVESLDLPDNEYINLKESSIETLDSFLSEDYRNSDVVLTSYTVLEPRSVPSGMTFFGTVGNRDFYQAFVNAAAFNIKETTFRGQKLESWANGILDLMLLWATTPISIAFSTVSLASGLGSSYEVLTDDEATVYFNVRLTYREIYTENSAGIWGSNTDPYVKVYQDDMGTATPFIVYVSTEMINGTFSHETQYETIDIKSNNYDKTSTVLYRANNRYLDKHKTGPWVESAVHQVIEIDIE